MANTSSYPSGGRYFSNSVNVDKTHPVLLEIYDATVLWQDGNDRTKTGAWRPAVPSDFAANVSISGGITANVSSVAVTGITQTSIVNSVLATSGVAFVSNFPSSTAITGSPLVTFSNSSINVALTGQPIYTTGTTTILGGTINVANTGVLNVTGQVISSYPSSTTVSTSTPSGSNGTALSANANRKQWFIQNNATGVLFVKLGAGASDSSYNMVIKGSTTPLSFDGSSFTDDGARWRGIVSVSGFTAPNYIAWELT